MVLNNDVADDNDDGDVDESSHEVPVEEVETPARATDGTIEWGLLCKTVRAHDQIVKRANAKDGCGNGNDGAQLQGCAVLQGEEENDWHNAGEGDKDAPVDGEGKLVFAEIHWNLGKFLFRHPALILMDAVVLKVGGEVLLVLLL